MAISIEVEIERNYAAFKDMLDELLSKAAGQYALLKTQELIGLYPSAGAAERAGYQQFRDEPYSIQMVSSAPVDLGFYSHAYNQR